MPGRLDAIDRQILKELQNDGRITNVELARRVGISAPPCLRRMRALEEAGFIKGYRALLDEKLLGYEVTVFAMVHLSSQAEGDLKAFEDFVRKEPLVRECWMLSGEIDFILKCVAPDLKTFQAFVAELTAAPHVRNVKTSLTLRNSKDAAMVPMEAALVLQFQNSNPIAVIPGPGACAPPRNSDPVGCERFMELMVLVGEGWHHLAREQLERGE